MNDYLLVSGTITATLNGVDSSGYTDPHKGMFIYVNISAISGSVPTYQLKIQHKDSKTGNYVDTGMQTAAISTGGSYLLRVYPGITQVANQDYAMVTPYVWRAVEVVGGTTPSVTRSVTVTTID